MSSKYVIIPNAGIGSRMRLDVPKQYYKLANNKTILDSTLDKFIDTSLIDRIILSISKDDNFWEQSLYYNHSKITVCVGGNTRFESVYNGLQALDGVDSSNYWVFVHDAARPFIALSDIEKLYKQSRESYSQAGILAIKAFETVKKVAVNNIILKTIDRNDIWLAQTPQLSRFSQLKKAFDFCYTNNLISKITDEASALELYGIKPIVVEGSRNNLKITTKDDLDFVNYKLND